MHDRSVPQRRGIRAHLYSYLVDYLSFSLHQPVVDRTGLKAVLLDHALDGAAAMQSPTGTDAIAAAGASQLDVKVAPTQR